MVTQQNDRQITVHPHDLDGHGEPSPWASCSCGAIWQADGAGPLGNVCYRDSSDGVTLAEWSARHVCLDDATKQRFADLVADARHAASDLMPGVAYKVTRLCRASLKVGFASIHGSQAVVDDLAEFEQWMSHVVAALQHLDGYLALDEPTTRHLHVVQDTPPTPPNG